MELLLRGSKGDQKGYAEVVSREKTVVGASNFDGDIMSPSVSHLRCEVGGFQVNARTDVGVS